MEWTSDLFIILQAGARSGCSITATRKCKPPWWKGLFGGATTDYQERERCEEREMASCLESAKEACIKFSKQKCDAPFRDARIASEGLLENTNFDVWNAGCNKTASGPLSVANSHYSSNPALGGTNYKGSDLLDSLASQDNSKSEWLMSDHRRQSGPCSGGGICSLELDSSSMK